MTIGEQIKDLRIKNGVSQERFAEDMQVSRQTVSRWETDAVTPKISQLEAISAYFGTELRDFFLSAKSEADEATERADSPGKSRAARNVLIALFILLFTGMGFIYAALVYIIYLLNARSGNTGENIATAESFAPASELLALIVFGASFIAAFVFAVYCIRKYRREKRMKDLSV